MMRSLVVLLLFLQTAAAAALSPVQAREAQREFDGADTNGDGFLERDEIMALDEVRTQPPAAEVGQRQRSSPGSGPRSGPGPGCQGQVRGSAGPSSTRPVCRWCASVSPRLAVRGGAGEQLASKQLRATALPVVVTS